MENKRKLTIFEYLFMPLGCLLQFPGLLMIGSTILVIAILFLTNGGNLLGPLYNPENYLINNHFQRISNQNLDEVWQIEYESENNVSFSGLVRHNSVIREHTFPMLTQDLLVTTGDFSDSGLVSTRVNRHRFRWLSLTDTRPVGTINLLHTIPYNQEILEVLQSIKKGDQVDIYGQEVWIINHFKRGKYLGFWQDTGCNTILVKGVTIYQTESD